MTESLVGDTGRCQWCRRPLPQRAGAGRPRVYCKQSCRQRDYEARRRAADLGLSEAEVVLARTELDALTDLLYVVEAAVEDVDGDLARSAEPDDVAAALAWVLDAARPLIAWSRARESPTRAVSSSDATQAPPTLRP